MELSKLFERCPLLLHTEAVEEEGSMTLLEEGVSQGRVGSRTLAPGIPESTMYWMKRSCKDTPTRKSPKVMSRTPTRASKKRSRPMFISPLIHEKSSNSPKRPRMTASSGADTFAAAPPSQQEGGEARLEQLIKEKTLLESKLKEKEGQLSKLKLVKLHRSKNDLPQLDRLVCNWRQVSQDVADALLAKSCQDPPPTMTQLLDYLHIDKSLIRYSTEQESFY